MQEEQIRLEQAPEQDPTRCYVCGEAAIATCTRCKLSICEEHREVKHEPVTRAGIVFCDECADYYEGLIQPDQRSDEMLLRTYLEKPVEQKEPVLLDQRVLSYIDVLENILYNS